MSWDKESNYIKHGCSNAQEEDMAIHKQLLTVKKSLSKPQRVSFPARLNSVESVLPRIIEERMSGI